VFAAARAAGVPIMSEFDLAAWWDDRPLLAITGTDGKTTVTTLVRDMLAASGLAAVAVGNTPVPLVAAIDDPGPDVFVVEASSFRLEHSQRFAPAVGTWLNFAPDHLDSHPDIASYRAAKAGIWRDQSADQVAVGNADDAVVAMHLAGARARRVTFALASDADFRLAGPPAPGGRLIGPVAGQGEVEIARVEDLARALPHDIANGLAAAATALADSYIQLLTPTRDDSPVARFLHSRGEGLHHVGYRVDDCAAALDAVKAQGGRVIDDAPRPGSRGTTVAFVHPKGAFGTLIELVQE
jgi:methylmalonyl-CoA epimerase